MIDLESIITESNSAILKPDKIICDMIKRNESDIGDVVFEILAKTVFKFSVLYWF